MRLIKVLSLAAATAVAAMAFIGAASALALNTQLCMSHISLTCSSGGAATSAYMKNTGTGVLLSSGSDLAVECDEITASATPLQLANPQQIHVLSLTLYGCLTNVGDWCEVTVLELPSFNLNKTGLDAGTVTATNGRIFVECEDRQFFTTDISCEYDLTGLVLSVGAQHLTANEAPINTIGSTFLCPPEPTLDGLLVTTENRYILA